MWLTFARTTGLCSQGGTAPDAFDHVIILYFILLVENAQTRFWYTQKVRRLRYAPYLPFPTLVDMMDEGIWKEAMTHDRTPRFLGVSLRNAAS